jgi:3-oxoacyl-[acyl-carrier protein] reductase
MLEGKVALIAGVGGGMGGATARLLAEHGASIAAIDAVAEPAASILAEIAATGRKTSLAIADLRDEEQVRAAFDSVLAELGRIDIVVTVAGGNAIYQKFRKLELWEKADWDEIFERNLGYVFIVLREALKTMVAQGDGGSIVMISSLSALSAPNYAAYGAAKAGVMQVAKSVAVEYGEHGIRINVIAPGTIVTPAMTPYIERNPASLRPKRAPLRRVGYPEEIAAPILFFASPMSSYVTGQTLFVDGGGSVYPPMAEEEMDTSYVPPSKG